MNTTPKKINGYVIPSKISPLDRVIRITVWTTASVVWSLLATYAGSQAAAFDPETSNFVWAVAQKMWYGVSQTISDISQAVNIIREKPNILSEINWDTVSREVIDLWSRLYEYIENSATSAAWNFVRKPIETLISAFGVAALIKWGSSIIKDSVILQDKPDFKQRIRSRVWNSLRSQDRSRNIEMPDKWWNQFLRK